MYEDRDSQLQPPGCPTYIRTSGKIVWELAFSLFQKGYHIYMDNYYQSLPLFCHLYHEKTLACGTARTNWKGFPHYLVTTKLQRRESVSLRNEEVLALKWRERRDVHVMTTILNNTLVELHGRHGHFQNPGCIHDYNQFMGCGFKQSNSAALFINTKVPLLV